jgi:hypothetical protein
VNGFIENLYTRLGTISNYSANGNLHNSKSLQHSLSLFQPAVSSPAVSWQWLLTVEILQLHALRFSLHSLHAELNSTWLCPLLITYQQGPHRKHRSSIIAFVSVAAGTCLRSRCPETAASRTTENTVLLLLLAYMLRALPSNDRCLQSHRLTTGLYSTLLNTLCYIRI